MDGRLTPDPGQVPRQRPHVTTSLGTAASGSLPPVVCGIDERYVAPLRTLMRSIAVAHGPDVSALRLIVLCRDLDSAARAAIETEGKSLGLAVQIRDVGNAPCGRYPVSGWASRAVYLRLSIPDVITDEPVVLYLDTDTLVLGDLRPLLTHPLAGAPLAAVRDPQNPTVGVGLALSNCQRLGLPAGREYFNSGVMLLDLVECRRLGIFDTAHRFLTTHPDEVVFWDQDGLNVAADDRWVRLDRCWNTFALSPLATRPDFVHYAEPVTALADLLADEYTAAVLHFAGPDKPWSDDYPASPLRDVYRRFHAPTLAAIP